MAIVITACTDFPMTSRQGRLHIAVNWPHQLKAQLIPPETRAFGIRVVTAKGQWESIRPSF
jgi:hypothetical protein